MTDLARAKPTCPTALALALGVDVTALLPPPRHPGAGRDP